MNGVLPLFGRSSATVGILPSIFWAPFQRLQKDRVSILKQNRNLETNSFQLRAENGQPISLPGPHIKVHELVPLIPKTAFKALTISERVYYTFTMTVRIPSIGKVRLIISFDHPELKGNCVVLVTNRLDFTSHEDQGPMSLKGLSHSHTAFIQPQTRSILIKSFHSPAPQIGFENAFGSTLLHLDCLSA